MSEDGQDRLEMPKDMRSMAEAGFDQARRAFEKFIGSAQAAADSLSARSAAAGSGARDINAIAFTYAEKNLHAALDYAEALLHAKDLSEVMGLQRDYVQAQFRALTEQASEMGQIMSRTAIDATKPKI